MSSYEVIVAGGGHNGLVAAGYLAKAGVKVLVVEARDYVGGGVATREVCAPGFKSDLGSVGHSLIQFNPLLLNDELDLKSKYGLQYIFPESEFANVFPDSSSVIFHRDVAKTCESIAQFSQHDADAYLRFYEWAKPNLEMLAAGMFAPPPSFGTLNSMMETSPEGRELLRFMFLSAHDVALEWFEDYHTINAFDRVASENMMDPRVDGSGINLVGILPSIHDYGCGLAVGGSGALSDALVRSIEDRGGEIRVSSPVKQFKVSGGRCTGVILEDGEEITATRAVITNFNILQLTSEMLGGAELPEEYNHNLKVLRHQEFQAFHQAYALDVAPLHKAGPEVDQSMVQEFIPAGLDGMAQQFDDYKAGRVRVGLTLNCVATRFDPTRAPEGKHTLYLYQYAPYHLAEGPQHWDVIKEEVADRIFDAFCDQCTNLSRDNIIGERWVASPLDLERGNRSWIYGEFNHLGMQISQSQGLRPFPIVSGYRLPVDGLYLTGPSGSPGGGVTGGGRNAVAVVMDDIGLNLDDVVS